MRRVSTYKLQGIESIIDDRQSSRFLSGDLECRTRTLMKGRSGLKASRLISYLS